ncbi:hypothetical protein D3C73_1293990 [compost metagenome]
MSVLLGIQRARPALAEHLVGEAVLNASEAILRLIDRVGQRSIIAPQRQRVHLPADLQIARLAVVGNVQLRRPQRTANLGLVLLDVGRFLLLRPRNLRLQFLHAAEISLALGKLLLAAG